MGKMMIKDEIVSVSMVQGSNMTSLIGALEPWNFMTSHSVGNVIIPNDELSIIFQRGRSTTSQHIIDLGLISPRRPWRNSPKYPQLAATPIVG
jgi:hypothetical protein